MNEMDEKQIACIVEQVVRETIAASFPPQNEKRLLGVFDAMEDALDASKKAYKQFRGYSVAQRENMLKKIRGKIVTEAETMAELGVSETKMGKITDKIIKHCLVADKTPGTEDLRAGAFTGDNGLTLIEMAPYGIIGSITPSTNPSETVLCNSIGMLAAGNCVVFNPHPNAVNVSNYAVDLVNRAVLEAGGPENTIVSVAKPTLQSADAMLKCNDIKLLVATGGPGVVRTLLTSGKKAIGAGAGNPPVIVDDTADIKKAAKDIVDGASFDNNLPCIAEKECFVLESVKDELIHHMTKSGAYLIKGENIGKLLKLALTETEEKHGGGSLKHKLTLNKKWVGKDAVKFLNAIGVSAPGDTKLIICETGFDHPFVYEELMMPILPVVAVKDIDTAIEYAVLSEHGNRHSAHMHSKNVDNMTRFARAVETTIFVKNGPSYAGIGAGGEGYTTFTIAGPTGEGLTSAKTFTRQRRCVLVDGFSIV
jgi:propionaldehyde dehydrogenase